MLTFLEITNICATICLCAVNLCLCAVSERYERALALSLKGTLFLIWLCVPAFLILVMALCTNVNYTGTFRNDSV